MKKEKVFTICLVVIIACSNIMMLHATEEQPLNAAITDISWTTVEYAFLNENYTNFEFTIDYDITNPNDENITLAFPNSGWRFYIDMNATFRNKNIEMKDYTSFGGLSVVCYENFSYGITSKTQPYWIGFNKQDLTVPPDGTYYLMIKSKNIDDSIVTSNITRLYIRDSNPTIIYDYTGPTINLVIPMSNLLNIGIISFTIVYYFAKRKRKNKFLIDCCQ